MCAMVFQCFFHVFSHVCSLFSFFSFLLISFICSFLFIFSFLFISSHFFHLFSCCSLFSRLFISFHFFPFSFFKNTITNPDHLHVDPILSFAEKHVKKRIKLFNNINHQFQSDPNKGQLNPIFVATTFLLLFAVSHRFSPKDTRPIIYDLAPNLAVCFEVGTAATWMMNIWAATGLSQTRLNNKWLPSGKRLHSYGKPPCLMGFSQLFRLGHVQVRKL